MPASFGGQPTTPRAIPGYVDTTTTMILTFLFGVVWFLIWLYPRMITYRERSGRTESRAVTYFWGYVGVIVLAVVTSPLNSTAILVLCWIATTVLGSLLMYEVVTDRDVYAASLGVLPQLQQRSLLVGIMVFANVICLLIGGLVLMLLIYLLAEDQNRIAQSAQNQGQPWT